jgi:hypothetical protein
MAEILAFVPKTAEAAQPRPEGPAQILFFTGIRYERHADPAEETAQAPRSGRARRTRERLRQPV